MKKAFLLAAVLCAVALIVTFAIPTDMAHAITLGGGFAAMAAAPGGVDLSAQLEEATKAFAKRDTEIMAAMKKAEEEIAATGKMHSETREMLTKLAADGTALQARLLDVEQKMGRRQVGGSQAVDFQKLFAENDQFKALAAGRSRSARVEIKRDDLMHAAITSLANSAGDLVVPQRQPGIISPQEVQPLVRDLIMGGRLSSNAIEYVRETGFTNMANMVSEGVLKPESALVFDMLSRPVRTVAHWVRASKQILDDVPQLLSYVQGRLRYGLKQKEDYQLLRGDNTGQNLDGLIPNATAYQTARTKAGDTKIDVIRHAITQVRIAEYRATAIIVNPTDWDEIETEKDVNGRYIWANVNLGGEQRLWRVPVLDHTAMNAGEFLVGAFTPAAQIFDREDASVVVSNEDQDNLVKNMVTILVEERLVQAIYRTEAFVYGDYHAVSGG
jgi:HK97 family phage major capsid protein